MILIIIAINKIIKKLFFFICMLFYSLSSVKLFKLPKEKFFEFINKINEVSYNSPSEKSRREELLQLKLEGAALRQSTFSKHLFLFIKEIISNFDIII